MRQLLIQAPGGQTRTVAITADRLTVGRASSADLCFPDDSGLSRLHLALARDGQEWIAEDLGSKNGTLVNDLPLKSRLPLKPGDRIAAGHLVITFDPGGAPPEPPTKTMTSSPVTFVEGSEPVPSATVFTNLENVMAEARGARQVRALIKAGTELAGHLPLPELFRLILDLAVEAVEAVRGAVMTVEDGDLVVQASKGGGLRISTAVRDRVIENHQSLLVRDTSMDEALRLRVSIVQQQVASLMAVPLQTGGRIIGLVYVDSPSFVRRFAEEDLNLLTVMANVAAVRIEHVRLAEIEQTERLIRRELEQAAEIQQRILPSGAPVVPGLDLAGYNAPCRTVGGDYYDFFPYPDGRVAILLGDVSGKGMPASLLMMGLQARAQVLLEEPADIASAVTRLNRTTCKNCPSNRFITLFGCVIAPAGGELVWANAGHNPPFLVRANGQVEQLEGGGPPLGILPLAAYETCRAGLRTGDMLVLYSDGVPEAVNAAEEEFGDERFAAVLAENRHRPAAEVVEAINTAVLAWAAGAPPADDLTIVVVRKVL